MAPTYRPLEERIIENIELSDRGCWLWTLYKNPDGYGRIRVGGEPKYAHRLVHEVLIGPIPKGMEIDHLCRVRHCVNPEHLECVTHKVNVLRGNSPSAKNVPKTHCPKGHPYAGRNLRILPSGFRECRSCKRARNQKYQAKRRARQQGVLDA